MTIAENSSGARPLLYAFAAFAAGIAAAEYVNFVYWIVVFAAAFISTGIFRKRRFVFPIAMVLFLSLGAVCAVSSANSSGESTLRAMLDDGRISADEPIEYEGVVASLPEVSPEAAIVDLDVERFTAAGETHVISGRLRLFVRLDSAEAAADMERLGLTGGTRIRVNCAADRSGRFLDPGVLPRDVLLERQGIDAVANVKSPLLIEPSDDAAVSPFGGVLAARQWTIGEFRRLFDGGTAGVMIASLLGNKQFLDRETADIFRDGGTFHVLVISGLHITFIGALLLVFVRLFTRRRMVQFVVTATLLWTYSIAVGAGSPVIRAVVMFTIFLFGYAIYRRGSLTNTLGACGIILLAWRPNDLFDPSFQLTMVSVGAIVAAGFPLVEKLRSIGKWTPSATTPLPPNVPNWLRRFAEMLYWSEDAWRAESRRHIWSANIAKRPFFPLRGEVQNAARYVFEAILVSAVVQIWMLPLLIYYFHRVPLGSVILNIWVGVVLAAESFAAVAAVAAAQISSHMAAPFVWLAETCNWLLTAAQGWFMGFGFGSLRIPIYGGELRGVYLVYFVPILAAAILLNRWQPFALKQQNRRPFYLSVAAVSAFAMLLVFHPFSAQKPDGKLHVTFLDVGQGDAAFIVFPNGDTMLVDGGGRIDLSNGENKFESDIPRIGEMVVSEYLWEQGYSSVGHIAASHPDVDHVQGLEDVARNFRVRDLLFAAAEANDDDMNRLFAEADERGIARVELTAGDTFEIGGAKIEVLSPPADARLSDNDSSLVFRLSYNGAVFLFTGDIESIAEEMLVNSGADLKANVVKVPHHGSRTSSSAAFIEAVKAGVAVISVGRRSMFGHPHKEVVERWNASGARLMTTGEAGAITFTVDENGRLYFEAFAKK